MVRSFETGRRCLGGSWEDGHGVGGGEGAGEEGGYFVVAYNR
jgi:hypothetical protein